MVLGLRPLLGVFVIWWLSFHQCRALANSVLSWRFKGSNTLGPNQLMECEMLSILLSPETSNPLGRETSYFILALEPGGHPTMSLVGHEPSSLQWTLQHPAGTQLFVALLDSFGTSLGVLPTMYTVIPGSKDCVAKSQSPGVLDATQPKISSSMFGRRIPCGPWELSIPGGQPTYSVSTVTLESGNVYDFSVPSESGEHILSFTSGGELSVQAAVIVGDANGMRDTMGSVSHIVDSADTPSAGISAALSRRRAMQPSDLPSRLRRPPRPTAFRPHRSLSDHPHMQFSRDLATINSSYTDTVIVAVCVSLGGTGVVVIAIYVIMKYRLRRELLDAQDTLPRPFEIIVPAATMTNASMITHGLTSVPMLDISRRSWSRSGGRGKSKARGEEVPPRIKLMRAGSVPTPTTTTPSQSQPSSSRNTRTQPDTSLSTNHAGPSYRSPSRSLHIHIPSDPQSQSGSRVQSGQLPSFLPTQPQRAAGVSVSRSASVQERRSAKRALWLSRSASELYRASSSVPRYRMPESSSHASSGRYAHRLDGGELHVDTFNVRPTNHLRQWHSASPMVRVEHVRSGSEEDLGRTIIFQHQDAGVMQELPPPYHKLVRSGVEV